ncbi:MAG TPA: hypothetical protein VMZ11_05760 [Mycobacteriales bacterium]|nr:hypothetical protein [Mycobacteriales bacterium]
MADTSPVLTPVKPSRIGFGVTTVALVALASASTGVLVSHGTRQLEPHAPQASVPLALPRPAPPVVVDRAPGSLAPVPAVHRPADLPAPVQGPPVVVLPVLPVAPAVVPVVEPPVVEPPVVEPPVVAPPVIEPPVIEPPVVKPPTGKPPVFTPHVITRHVVWSHATRVLRPAVRVHGKSAAHAKPHPKPHLKPHPKQQAKPHSKAQAKPHDTTPRPAAHDSESADHSDNGKHLGQAKHAS